MANMARTKDEAFGAVHKCFANAGGTGHESPSFFSHFVGNSTGLSEAAAAGAESGLAAALEAGLSVFTSSEEAVLVVEDEPPQAGKTHTKARANVFMAKKRIRRSEIGTVDGRG